MPARCADSNRQERPVELIESVPVESGLGNPELRSAHDVWIEMIRNATCALDMEEFYLSDWPNEPLRDVLAEIRKTAARGVNVRLILDAGFHKTYSQPADSLDLLPHLQVRTIDMRARAGGIQHAKFFLTPNTVFLGSQNADWRALKHIHELGIRIADAQLATMFAGVFLADWNHSIPVDSSRAEAPTQGPAGCIHGGEIQYHVDQPTREDPWSRRLVQAPGDTAVVRPSVTPRGLNDPGLPDSVLWDRDAVIRLIDRAHRQISVQLLTYGVQSGSTRDTTIDAALRRAAARGVEVRLLVSDWEADNAARMRVLQDLSRVKNVEAKLGTVPEWSGGYIPFARVEHCKYMVVDDDLLWVGTSNWEPDYFHRSRNVAVTIENRRLTQQARRIFETSWRAPGAQPVDPERTYPRKVHGDAPPPGAHKYGG